IEMIDRGIPRSHYEICDADGNKLGEVTSGTMSPTLQKGIALGYVPTAHSKVGTEVFVKVRDKLLKAVVTKLPFVKAGV
nr:glycine cleavage system aminomethyltransferase GcvT [Spirosomataceae bacterium]